MIAAFRGVLRWLWSQWFLWALAIILPVGMLAGLNGDVRLFFERFVDTRWYVAGVLFLMSVSLELSRIRQTAARPIGIVVAVLVSIVLMPVLAWGMLRWQAEAPFAVGLLLTAVVPATMASAAVWTRRAAGNDAIPLMVTLITSGSCFLVVPFWLWLFLGETVSLDTAELMWHLLVIALLPMCVGQMCRGFGAVRGLVERQRSRLNGLAQIGLLLIVTVGAVKTGPVLAESAESVTLGSLLGLAVQCLLLHGGALLACWYGVLWLGGNREDALGAMFAGSQKTLPIAVELATSPVLLAAGINPLMIVPPLLYHALQLFCDSLLVERLKPSSGNLPRNPQQIPPEQH